MTGNSVTGDLQAFSIFDVTQSLMIGRKTAQVTIESGIKRGFLYFKEGQIVAALDDQFRIGEAAAASLFSWRGGTFCIDFDKEIDKQNIDVPTDYLLLEVARSLDEARRDTDLQHDPLKEEEHERIETEILDRTDERLRKELNTAFNKVASSVEPTRALYRSDAFDSHLRRLVELEGSALFLQVDLPPRIRAAGKFVIAAEASISRDEMSLYLAAALNDKEMGELEKHRDVISLVTVDDLGSFRLHAVLDSEGYLLTFTPAQMEVPGLSQYQLDPELETQICGITSGLVVVAGPLGCGKSTFVASIARAHMETRDAFALLFSSGRVHHGFGPRGYCIGRAMPPPGGAFHGALRAALDVRPDILGIAGAADREALRDAFHVALGASGRDLLVIYSLDSQSIPDTLTRLLRLARTADGDPLWDALGENLRMVIDLRSGPRNQSLVSGHLEVDRAVQALVQAGDLRALKQCAITPVVA